MKSIITASEYENNISKNEKYIDEMIDQINHAIQSYIGHESILDLILESEHPKKFRSIISEKLKDSGWGVKRYDTSSENGERPGLTRLIIYPLNIISAIDEEEQL